MVLKIQQYLCLMVCSFILNSGIRAEDAEFTLGEIIVSGESPRVVESISTVDTVTAEDIRRSSARNLNEAIKLLPGVYIRTGGDGTPGIDIRGLRTRQVILLLDGVPINSAIDGQFDPSTIDVANIERIKVTRGTSSLLYGTGGTAGVINIITKSGGKPLQVDALAEFGEEGTRRGQISAGKGGDDWNTFVSASGYHRDSFKLSDDYDPVPVTGAPNPNNFQPGGDRINSDRTDSNLYANFLWRGLPRTEVGISGGYRKGYYGKPAEVRDFTGGDADPFARRPRFERLDDYEGFSLDLTGKYKFQIPLTLQPTLFFNRLDELTNNYDNADFQTQNINRSFRQSTRSDIAGANLQASYDMMEHGLSSAAINCRHEQWDARGFQRIAGNALQTILIDESADICSFSYEHELKLFDRFGLTGGAGYAWQDRPSGDDDGLTYLVGGYYDLFPGTRIHVSHSHLIRFPTLRDLFEPGRANPNLESEKTDHYEAGIQHEFSQFPAGLGITVFRIDAEDFIETDSNGIAQNVEEDRFEGVEVTAETRPLDSLTLRAAYTFLESRNLSTGVTNRDLQNRPQHQLSVETLYQFPWDMHLYLAWLHIEGNLDLSRQTPIRSRETGNYDVLDLKVEKNFGNASVYARALNLLDEDYVESAGFPAPGRTVLVGGELSFGM